MTTRTDGLEIDDAPEFQRKLWVLQRWSWGALAAVLAFGAVGGFGRGPLSWAEARDESGRLRVVYERFGRMDSADRIELRGRPDADGRLRLRVGDGLLEDYEVSGLEAYRGEAQVEGEGVVYVVQGVPDDPAVTLRLELRPLAPGRARIEVGLAGEGLLRLSQFVYP